MLCNPTPCFVIATMLSAACLSVCPSLSACLSVCLGVCACLPFPSDRLPLCCQTGCLLPSVRLSVCPSVRLSVCPSVCPTICLTRCLSNRLLYLNWCLQTEQLLSLAQLYHREQYLLVWRGCKGQVLLQETAQPTDMLRALWQVMLFCTHAYSAMCAEKYIFCN